MPSKIILEGYITVPNADLEIIRDELPIHTHLTRQESGCILFEVSQDTNDNSRFNVHEEFINQEAFDIHQKRVKDSNWGKITTNVQRHYQIKKVTICH